MIETATTFGIRIDVESFFVPEKSDASKNQYFFAYSISITNTTEEHVQLLNRRWVITDGWGRVEEVQGPGVIGLQPWIEPGATFQYQSFCPLTTPTGSMRGQYEMVSVPDDTKGNRSGEGPARSFSADIPQFFLVEPGSFH